MVNIKIEFGLVSNFPWPSYGLWTAAATALCLLLDGRGREVCCVLLHMYIDSKGEISRKD